MNIQILDDPYSKQFHDVQRAIDLPKNVRVIGYEGYENEPGSSVVFTDIALSKMINYGEERKHIEAGGYMLASRTLEGAIQIEDFVPIPDDLLDSDGARLNFSQESQAGIWRQIDKINSLRPQNQLFVAGWYHTHPAWDVFLSGPDQFIQKAYFGGNDQLAAVYDPILKRFCVWKNIRSEKVNETIFGNAGSSLVYQFDNGVTASPLGGFMISGDKVNDIEFSYPETSADGSEKAITIQIDSESEISPDDIKIINVGSEPDNQLFEILLQIAQEMEILEDGTQITIKHYEDGSIAIDFNNDNVPDVIISELDLAIIVLGSEADKYKEIVIE